jgi:hypothetical protein
MQAAKKRDFSTTIPECFLVLETALDSKNIPSQDTRMQAQNQRRSSIAQVSSEFSSSQWNDLPVLRNTGFTRRKETTHRPLWGYSTSATKTGNPGRSNPDL